MSRPPSKHLQSQRRTKSGVSLTMTEPEGSEVTYSPATTTPSSPASSRGEHRRSFSINSMKGRTWRSMSNSGRDRDVTPDSAFRGHVRKLSKSRPYSASPVDGFSRRSSGVSEDHISSLHSRLSFTTIDAPSLTPSSSTCSVDWKSQRIEGGCALEPDTSILKTKTPFLLVTTDYLLRMKSRADAVALFPALAIEGEKVHHGSAPDPALAIPISGIVAAFYSESIKPSFGIEVWWKGLGGQSFHRAEFFFSLPREQQKMLESITRVIGMKEQDEAESTRRCDDVKALMQKIQMVEEPIFVNNNMEIFPVIPRGVTRKEYMPKMEDASKKSQEGSAYYLVIGTYLCYLAEVHRGKAGSTCRHRTFGLVTLSTVVGDWSFHEERFNISFREPFKSPVTLELASRYYRHIIRILGTADRYIKPNWPQLWQNMEIFSVSGLRNPQYLVSREDYGAIKRTLDAHIAGYRCAPVDWEINWKTRHAPEFRLLPSKTGAIYTPLQLLAVLRALRYNDYFNSLSFKDVDLSPLHGADDNLGGGVNVAYLSRTCIKLTHDEVLILKTCPVLHQEFHALAYCSETIRQIDFTNCTYSLNKGKSSDSPYPTLQFLTPILHLLKTSITKCNRLILAHNHLSEHDISNLAETMETGTIRALDISACGLDDTGVRRIAIDPVLERPLPLESLTVSSNHGRIPSYILPDLLQHLPEIRDLNFCGSILGDSSDEGPLLPCELLESLQFLESFDVTGWLMNDETLMDLQRFLMARSWRIENGGGSAFRQLVLNQCGITGFKAAALFESVGRDRGLHIGLSRNPIENGIGKLAAVIRENWGPAGLDMEMVEFQDEDNYLALVHALTEAKHLTVLNMAGTAPAPSPTGVCSTEMVNALHDLFARNTSIRCLDLSGFSGRLDDGQLTKGFGRSLSGLGHNRTMTHLRIRNQNLHNDAGTLGQSLKKNNALMVLDCQENNLNLNSFSFLVDSMKVNRTIIDFPFAPKERADIWKNVLKGLRPVYRPPNLKNAAGKEKKHKDKKEDKDKDKKSAAEVQVDVQETALWGVLQTQFKQLDGYIERNRELLEAASGQAYDFESPDSMLIDLGQTTGVYSTGTAGTTEWPTLLDLEFDLGTLDLSDTTPPPAPTVLDGPVGQAVSHDGTFLLQGSPNLGAEPAAEIPKQETKEKKGKPRPPPLIRRKTVRSSVLVRDEPPPTPSYSLIGHVGLGSTAQAPDYPPPPPPPAMLGMLGAIESPTDTLDPVSEVETPGPDDLLPSMAELRANNYNNISLAATKVNTTITTTSIAHTNSTSTTGSSRGHRSTPSNQSLDEEEKLREMLSQYRGGFMV
ncbi:hypothetical protein QBC40DRAFT_5587 [Triangularia verruculosa]|uniref:LRR-containing protein second PH domain-containing protein n=1 Tax=Triangularia verruculosa TaxID=2587418 RepID=A0AAN6XBT7_9PEZI|nr:hypothetical protein QBC40DRAFT_5587 [Triangularia verruculosa]